MTEWYEQYPEVGSSGAASPPPADESPARKMFREAGFGAGATTSTPPAAAPRMDTDTPARRMFEEAGFHRGAGTTPPAAPVAVPDNPSLGRQIVSGVLSAPGYAVGAFNATQGWLDREAEAFARAHPDWAAQSAANFARFGGGPDTLNVQGVHDAPVLTAAGAAAPFAPVLAAPLARHVLWPVLTHPVRAGMSALGGAAALDSLGLTDSGLLGSAVDLYHGLRTLSREAARRESERGE